ncbi:serine/threonine protein kinase [Dactylosporangium siamense]|nr:protein kinase [Dactylosporangium siamense]
MYQLNTVLGQGGEGSVWKASVPLSGEGVSWVAIKILRPTPNDDPERWMRHSHLLPALDHPGIVRVIRVFVGYGPHRRGLHRTTQIDDTVQGGGETHVTPPARPATGETFRYVVMSLIEGETLGDWLAEQANATASQRIRALRTVAAALDYMHSGESTNVPVAHGDVKPENIVRRADGSTVLVDLGLVRLADDTGQAGRTRAYAAPELFERGAMATPESDRFAFVATVVHALLGQAPPTVDRFGPDLAAIEGLLTRASTTAARPQLAHTLMTALRCPPEQRPRPLSQWLSTLTDTLSSTTSADGFAAPPYDRGITVPFTPSALPAPPRARDRPRLILIGVLAAVLAIATVLFVAKPFSGRANDAGAAPTAGAQGSSPSRASSPPPSPTPSPTPSADPSASTTATPTATGTSTPGPTPSGEVVGMLIAGPTANDSGVIVTRSENSVLGMSINAQDFSINGVPVTYGWVASCKLGCSSTQESYVELNLGRSYTRLEATFGISDKSSGTGPLTIQIAALDNNQTKIIFKQQFTIGDGGKKTVNVTGILRLKISFIGTLRSTRGALGDPTLY